MVSIDTAAIDSFLDFYFERTTQNIEIRCIPSRKQLFTRDKSEAMTFIERHKKENLYFGVASRNGGGKAENARELIFLFADLDFKTFPGGEQEAREQLDSFALAPSGIVHSGNGLHAYWLLSDPIENVYERQKQVKAALLGIAEAVKGDTQVCEIARVMRLPGSVNFKNGKQKPVTFEKWDTSTAYALDAFLSLKEYASINTNSYSYKGFDTHSATLFTEGSRNSDLFHIAHCLTKGGAKKDEAMQVLRILAQKCIPSYPENEIETIIQSALDRKVRGEAGLTEDIKRIISVSDGSISVSNIVKAYQEYQNIASVSNSIKTQIRVVVKRLKESGFIEKAGKEDGIYRLVMNECEEIDFLNASTDAFSIVWPFQIEHYVKTHPKNIIVVAGSPNAGKTAFLLNTVAMNMDRLKVNYFSSEMGPIELKERLSKFNNVKLSNFKKVKWLERSGNFADVIRPDEVNVIDFLEMTDNFYLVAEHIKNVFEKLRAGIAIIAIQKNPGLTLGLGGARSLEKARLYLTMDSHILKIEKGKNWTEPTINPNGLSIRFKLVQGCHFIAEGKWEEMRGKN